MISPVCRASFPIGTATWLVSRCSQGFRCPPGCPLPPYTWTESWIPSHACADDDLDKIYDSGCALSQDLSLNSTIGHCDSQYFICRPLTTEIYGYDDPVTGLAYACVDNPEGAETCEEEDEVNLCVRWSPRFVAFVDLIDRGLTFPFGTVQLGLPT